MKRKLPFLLGLLVHLGLLAQTTVTIPDDALEAYLETEFASNISPDGSTTDGSITFIDIDLIDEIDLPTAGVTTVEDMTGINQFPELKNLYCNDNQITGTIDVSNLPDLTNFYFYNNIGVTGINVSNCPKIYHVKGYGCSLTNVDFSLTTTGATDNTRLRYLYLYDNNLTMVDISGNIALYRIDLYNNSLTSIDVSGITTLQYLRIHNNQLTGDLDVSENLGLQKLGTYGNDLSSINLGAIPYTSFNYFKISSNPNLTCVITDTPSDYEIGGSLETSLGSNYSVDTSTNFVEDQAACDALVTENFKQQIFNVYPNPVKNVLTITAKENLFYAIYDISGRKILENDLLVGVQIVQLDTLESGIYFLSAKTSTGKLFSKKIIKK